MNYERMKRSMRTGLVSLAIAGAFILSAGFSTGAVASAQSRYDRDRWERRDNDWDRRHEREEMDRVRRFDRDHQLRFRMNNSIRVVGFYDRWGRFHAYGFYDRFGRFHRY